MGAVFLLLLVVLMVVNLLFTFWLWKGKKMEVEKNREMVIPRGVPAVQDSGQKAPEIDYAAIAAAVNGAMERNAEESGEDETQVSPDEIAQITKSVLAGLKA